MPLNFYYFVIISKMICYYGLEEDTIPTKLVKALNESNIIFCRCESLSKKKCHAYSCIIVEWNLFRSQLQQHRYLVFLLHSFITFYHFSIIYLWNLSYFLKKTKNDIYLTQQQKRIWSLRCNSKIKDSISCRRFAE